MGETVDDKIRLNYFLSLNEFSMLLISAEKAVVVAEGLLFLVVVWESHIIIIVLIVSIVGKSKGMEKEISFLAF
ncbi:MAG: hypothetical protein II530_03610 [Bacteroidaceae bacterium]|jgi:hypothetical protein|nr:hypothetical protein [Bacteroidaceae bacterium]